MIEHGQPLYDKRTNVLHIVADARSILGYFVKVTVKATQRGHQIWLTSAHRIRPTDLRKLQRKARESGR